MSGRQAGSTKDRPDSQRERPLTGGLALKWTTLKAVVALVWALIVGGLMAGGAAMLGESSDDVVLIGVLGGMGAAVFIFVFAARR